MLNPHDERTIQAKTETVLETLKKNLAEHILAVEAAKAGYLVEAERLLKERLRDLRRGKTTSLAFDLRSVQDHRKDYETVIRMFELHLEAGETTIALKAADVTKYVLNQWDWKGNFDAVTSTYVGRVK